MTDMVGDNGGDAGTLAPSPLERSFLRGPVSSSNNIRPPIQPTCKQASEMTQITLTYPVKLLLLKLVKQRVECRPSIHTNGIGFSSVSDHPAILIACQLGVFLLHTNLSATNTKHLLTSPIYSYHSSVLFMVGGANQLLTAVGIINTAAASVIMMIPIIQ
mmetsp:Transcript_2102/g.3840  ORF Transcript_2102/g.3840 Transcript_2102/m.3840 type:complete len:160 (+) Transcript_2102:3456-3935(+)